VAVFSVRHRRGLASEAVAIELNPRVRGRLWRLIERHDHSYETSDNGSWSTFYTSAAEETESRLGDVYGTETLPSPHGNGLRGLIQSGADAHVLDALEVYRQEVMSDSTFATDLNTMLREEGVPWQMIDGEVVLLDTAFAQELAERSTRSTAAAGFDGAMDELRHARSDVADGDHRGAIHNAGKAHESVMKALLSRDDGTAKKLAQDLDRAGYFDGLPKTLREQFIQQVLTALPWMRNKLGGHGQGEKAVDVPRPYAQLANDLASSYVHFLVSLKEEREGTASADAGGDFAKGIQQDDDIPF
jgi:hypothetical protein